MNCPKCGARLFQGHTPQGDADIWLCGSLQFVGGEFTQSMGCENKVLNRQLAEAKKRINRLEGLLTDFHDFCAHGFDKDNEATFKELIENAGRYLNSAELETGGQENEELEHWWNNLCVWLGPKGRKRVASSVTSYRPWNVVDKINSLKCLLTEAMPHVEVNLATMDSLERMQVLPHDQDNSGELADKYFSLRDRISAAIEDFDIHLVDPGASFILCPHIGHNGQLDPFTYERIEMFPGQESRCSVCGRRFRHAPCVDKEDAEHAD